MGKWEGHHGGAAAGAVAAAGVDVGVVGGIA